jgi:hypothetical protein
MVFEALLLGLHDPKLFVILRANILKVDTLVDGVDGQIIQYGFIKLG